MSTNVNDLDTGERIRAATALKKLALLWDHNRRMSVLDLLVLLSVASYEGNGQDHADRLGIGKSTISATFKRLSRDGDDRFNREGSGWVEFVPDPEDARSRIIVLTAAGKAFTEALLRGLGE